MTGDRYLPPESRDAAIELVLAAFDVASRQRVSTPPEVTMAQGGLALLLLGASEAEVARAADVLGLSPPGK